ncbi:MFS transporter [Streptosporangium sp. NPDC001559]|uniref:MFS transporter n=1 Tax=Streptosporangium sp. NPDC001559 TaxID=3366187 RepID=UPI0036E48ED9
MTVEPQENAPAELDAAAPAEDRPWSTLAVVGIAQMLVMLDSTVVNVALPSIGDSIHASAQALQWAISGYVITYGSLLLFGGRLADVRGRRTMFLLGLAIFALASLGAGLAANGAMLVASRVIQGTGTAVLSAAALSIIIATYRSSRQMNIALTVWSGLGVVGATIGVIAGGAIVEYASWRWVFLINLPIGVVLSLAALRSVAPMRRELDAPRSPLRLPTAIAVTMSLCLVSYAFIDMQDGVGRLGPWAFLVLGVVILAAVVRYERHTDDPLLPLFLLRIRTYALACAGMVMAATLLLGSLYLGSNYFQRAAGLTPLETGLALLPLCLGSLVAAFGIPKLAQKIGMPKIYLSGVLVQLISIVVLAVVTWGTSQTVPTVVVIAMLGIYGLGLPTMFVPLYTFGAAEIPERHSGTGSGLLNTFNESGAGLGLAIVAPIAAYIATRQRSTGTAQSVAEAHGIAAAWIALCVCSLVAALIAIMIVRAFRATHTAGR